MQTKCPHCGGTQHETNGATNRDDMTWLCVTRVLPEDASLDYDLSPPEPKDIDADGKVICGEQWNPYDEELEDEARESERERREREMARYERD